MIIADDLRLVIPVSYDDSGDPSIYAYHTPISHAVFQANYAILARTNAALFKEGLAYAHLSGLTTAALELRDQAKRYAEERGIVSEDGKSFKDLATPLFAEIERLTLILAPTASGWQELPVAIAKKQAIITEEEWREAESQLVFFSASYSLESRRRKVWRMAILADMMQGSQITSLRPTEWIDSLQTSKKADSPEHNAPVASSVPI